MNDNQTMMPNVTVIADERTGRMWRIALSVVLPTLIIFGTVGNMMSLAVFRAMAGRRKRRHSRNFRGAATYAYIRAMTRCDLATMVLLWSEVVGGWGANMATYTAAFYMAHVHLVLLNTSLVTSALLVVCITVERFISVCLPHRRTAVVSEQRLRVQVLCLLAGVLLAFLPTAIAFSVVQVDTGVYVARPVPEVHRHLVYTLYTWLHIVTFKFLPIVLVVTLNVVTYVRYRSHRDVMKKQAGVTAGVTMAGGQQERRLMVILFATGAIYVVCLTPMAFSFLIEVTQPETLSASYEHNVFQATANLLEYASSAANFYVYCVASRDFRTKCASLARRLRRVVWRCWRQDHRARHGTHLPSHLPLPTTGNNNHVTLKVTPENSDVMADRHVTSSGDS